MGEGVFHDISTLMYVHRPVQSLNTHVVYSAIHMGPPLRPIASIFFWKYLTNHMAPYKNQQIFIISRLLLARFVTAVMVQVTGSTRNYCGEMPTYGFKQKVAKKFLVKTNF